LKSRFLIADLIMPKVFKKYNSQVNWKIVIKPQQQIVFITLLLQYLKSCRCELPKATGDA
jgi:hypothetical protein